MHAVLKDIEAVINARPLTCVSDNKQDGTHRHMTFVQLALELKKLRT